MTTDEDEDPLMRTFKAAVEIARVFALEWSEKPPWLVENILSLYMAHIMAAEALTLTAQNPEHFRYFFERGEETAKLLAPHLNENIRFSLQETDSGEKHILGTTDSDEFVVAEIKEEG